MPGGSAAGSSTRVPTKLQREGGRELAGRPQEAGLRQWDPSLVPCQPRVEVLQLWIEPAGDLRIARATKNLLKIAFELKHVAEIVGTGKAEGAIHLRRHGVVPDLLTE